MLSVTVACKPRMAECTVTLAYNAYKHNEVNFVLDVGSHREGQMRMCEGGRNMKDSWKKLIIEGEG